MRISAYVAWCSTATFLGLAWILSSTKTSWRERCSIALVVVAVCMAGLFARPLALLVLSQRSTETAISVLGATLTLAAAYGVYVSQKVDKQVTIVESELSSLDRRLGEIKLLNEGLESTLQRQQRELEASVEVAHVQALRQAIIAYFPERLEVPVEMRSAYPEFRGILMDAVSRSDLAQAKYDCDELEEFCRSRHLSLDEFLEKARVPFSLYRRMADEHARRGLQARGSPAPSASAGDQESRN